MGVIAASAGVAQAHAALLRDGALQFDLPAAAPLPPPAAPWHPSLGFGEVDVVWVLAALGVALAVGLAVAYLRDRPAEDAPPPAPGAAAPAPIPPAAARLALDDADRLAAGGRHLDAARTLLRCGLDAIAERHPAVLRPTVTSRDVVRDPTLPDALRTGFAPVAHAVEVGLFGGRPLGPGDYAACRAAFVASALGGRA